MFVPDCYRNKKKNCHGAIDNYVHALEFLPDCYKTQKKRLKAVDTYPSAIQFRGVVGPLQPMHLKGSNLLQ